MSYEIDVTSVRAVLLADGWHRVKGKSFGIEPYGYVIAPEPVKKDATAKEKDVAKDKGDNGNGARRKAALVAGVADKSLPPVMGARWVKPNGEVIACPVSSVLALRHSRSGKA